MLKGYVKSKLWLDSIVNRNYKAAGMLEYMLVAVISVAAFIAIKTLFPDFLDGLWGAMEDSINLNK